MLLDKILIIDDDIRVIQSMRMILKEYEIIEFQDGQDALKFLSRPHSISLVLLDVYMNGSNGIDVLSQIKKMEKDLAVVIMTAFGSKDIVIEALRADADDFIEKPFNVGELRDKVKSIVRERSPFHGLDTDSRIERIKRFIERNMDDICLNDIAEELCLSPKYISRLIREGNSDGFRTYKVNLKINKAKYFLEKSSYTISQISERLGYSNPESFMRIFKRVTKFTPMEFRKKNQK